MTEPSIVAVEDIEAEGAAPFSVHTEPFDALYEDWAALHAESGARGPFQHPAWHRAWLKHFGDGVDPLFLAVRREARLIGVVALQMRGGGARELGDPSLRDYGGPLCAPGFENDVVLALLDWVAEDMTPRLELWGLRARDELTALFQAEAADNGWTLTVEPEAVAPVAALPPTWEEYLAGLSKHDRHEIRRKLRNLEAAGTIDYATADGALDAGLTDLFAMMRGSHEGKETFLDGRMEAFFRDLVSAFAPLGMMRLGTLTLDGKPIARLFTFEDEQAMYLYNSGFDPARAHLAPGLLSKALAIRDAIGRDKTRFEFLRGEEEYKRRLGGHGGELVKLTFVRR